jgi:hypothetical protein
MAFLAPNFTETGIGLVKAPEDLTATLQAAIRKAIRTGKTRKEHAVKAIGGPNGCLFVDRPDLTAKVSAGNNGSSRSVCCCLCSNAT